MYRSRLPKWNNDTPQKTAIKVVSKTTGRKIRAYTNRLNELLIQNPMDVNRSTVYPSIDSYTRRMVLPESRYKSTIDMVELTPVTIDTEKLIVINPKAKLLD